MSERINILHVITKLELGGAQKNALSILEGLEKEKYNLHLISGSEGLLVEDALALKDVRVKLIASLRREINPFFDARALYRLFREIKKEKIDIVHTHSSKAGILGRWAARWAGVPRIVHTIHGWGFHSEQGRFLNRLFILLERLTAKITTRLIAVSEADIQKGIENRIGGKSKYTLIRYGIDKKKFSDQASSDGLFRKEFGLHPNSYVVGMVAPFKPQKGPQDFVKVASLVNNVIPNTRYLLVGDGELKGKVIALAKKLELEGKFILTGWRRDIDRIMRILDVFVLTSRWEGLPIVLLEAMASAKAIVATSVGGVSEVILDEERGLLAPSGDVDTIAGMIIKLLKDKGRTKRMGEMGQRFILAEPDFDCAYMVNRIARLYEDLRAGIGTI